MQYIYTDQTYLKNNPTWHEEDAPFKAGKIIELLNRNSIDFNSVCEMGCGSGEILVQLANHFNKNIYTPPVYEAATYKQKIINVLRKILFSVNKRFCTKTIGG